MIGAIATSGALPQGRNLAFAAERLQFCPSEFAFFAAFEAE
ncbi:hypothetical protein [Arboricoccus pini]|nr:hypothetical protein [Arboricoccus pini]